MTTVINAIRQRDPDNIIIVGTPSWSQDVDAAAQDPLHFSNIMYFATINNGAEMQQWYCNGHAAQQWQLSYVSDGYYMLKNIVSGKCLDVYSFGLENGVKIIQWSCHGANNQQWRVEKI